MTNHDLNTSPGRDSPPAEFDSQERIKQRQRVVAIIDAAPVSGPGRQLVALAVSLKEHGIDLHVILFARRGRPVSSFQSYLVSAAVTHTVVHERGPGDLLALLGLRRLLVALAPDVVQTHGYKPTTLVWLLRLFGLPTPWVAYFHGRTDENAKVRLYNKLHERLLRNADTVVFVSERHRKELSVSHSKVIHNAVLKLPVRPDPAFRAVCESLPIPQPRLLTLGRLSPEKGVDTLLHAMRLLVDGGMAPGLMIVGDGPERDRLKELARSLNLDAVVCFLDATEDVLAAYEAADAVVLPSRSEGLPNVLLEAIDRDLPVLATDVGAVREVLGDTRAGIIVPPGQPFALAEAIPRLLELMDDAEATQARRLVALRFSMESRVRSHLSLYAGAVLGDWRD